MERRLTPDSPVYAMALRTLGNVDDAEEVAQETAVRAISQEFVDDEHRVRWAKVVSQRLATDCLRHRQRAALLADLPEVIEHDCDPADLVARQQAVRILIDALGAVPADLRNLLWRHHVDGVPLNVLAREHGVSHAAMRKRLQRARNQTKHEYLKRGGPLCLFAMALPDLGRVARIQLTAAPVAASVLLATIVAIGTVTLPSVRHRASPAHSRTLPAVPGYESRLETPTPGVGTTARMVRSVVRHSSDKVTVARIGTVQVGPVRKQSVRVTRRHGEETFMETVQRCLRKGITVTPTSVHCNE